MWRKWAAVCLTIWLLIAVVFIVNKGLSMMNENSDLFVVGGVLLPMLAVALAMAVFWYVIRKLWR